MRPAATLSRDTLTSHRRWSVLVHRALSRRGEPAKTTRWLDASRNRRRHRRRPAKSGAQGGETHVRRTAGRGRAAAGHGALEPARHPGNDVGGSDEPDHDPAHRPHRSLVILGLVAQAGGFGTTFQVLAIGLAVVGLILGTLTSVRVFLASDEDAGLILAMNQLRAAYAELAPGSRSASSSTRLDEEGSCRPTAWRPPASAGPYRRQHELLRRHGQHPGGGRPGRPRRGDDGRPDALVVIAGSSRPSPTWPCSCMPDTAPSEPASGWSGGASPVSRTARRAGPGRRATAGQLVALAVAPVALHDRALVVVHGASRGPAARSARAARAPRPAGGRGTPHTRTRGCRGWAPRCPRCRATPPRSGGPRWPTRRARPSTPGRPARRTGPGADCTVIDLPVSRTMASMMRLTSATPGRLGMASVNPAPTSATTQPATQRIVTVVGDSGWPPSCGNSQGDPNPAPASSQDRYAAVAASGLTAPRTKRIPPATTAARPRCAATAGRARSADEQQRRDDDERVGAETARPRRTPATTGRRRVHAYRAAAVSATPTTSAEIGRTRRATGARATCAARSGNRRTVAAVHQVVSAQSTAAGPSRPRSRSASGRTSHPRGRRWPSAS